MNPRLPFDDVAWEKSDQIEDSWLDLLFNEDIYNEIGIFLAENHCPRQWADFKFLKCGGFNASFLITFTDTDTGGAVLRLPLPGVHMFPEEKVRNEASIMQFITERTSKTMPIPVPLVSRWGERNESPSNLGPFIIMGYIDHERSISDLLETPGRQSKQRPELNPDISTIKLKALYRELANIVFSLSILSANRIGSLKQTGKLAWEVTRLTTAGCDDFRPQNIIVDKAEKVVGVVDWEFTYTAPVEFTYTPPWWLLLEKPEYWTKGLDNWCAKYERRLQIFLQAMIDCEEDAYQTRNERLEENQRLSSRMRQSWESGDFWIIYAARNNFAFDAIYWNKIDRRFFGSNKSDNNICDAWKKRLHLLEPEEKESMDKYVDLKLQENKTRLLSWDPDQYTLDYMAKMEA
ncbi:uncharacterized protein N7479_009110 [Penicillium vulpinum]|uniref:uncharacterized protein n=1 Tax=Penicillium vulpinum TaxID=29845 RepID=UPI002547A785|nr:uncharacterized protein N7479_009110 [Penicillium vulpinum]KAJ5950697.1 hypothetical protein N7479_009110 [Penicillium vulpinum]